MRGKKIAREVVRKEDQSKTCTICGKIFVNGKALGGHLRSHYAKLPLDSDRDPDLGKKPADSPPVLESATRRRSARARASGSGRFVDEGEDSRAFSGDSRRFSQEYGAECLMMLSRDSWERKSGTPQVTVRPEEMYVSSSRNDVVPLSLKYASSSRNDVVSVNGAGGHKYQFVSYSRSDRSFSRGGKARACAGGEGMRVSPSRNDGSFCGRVKTAAYGGEDGEYDAYECGMCKQVFESGERERHVCGGYLAGGGGRRYCSSAGGSMIDLNRLPGLQLEDGGDDGLTEEEVSSTEEDE